MIGFKTDVIRPQVNATAVTRIAAKLADDLGLTMANNIRIALIRRKKVVTGKTLKSVTTERILDSASRGMFKRHVIGNRSTFFIETGRRAGGKMPPLAAMMPWFLALRIPKALWYPIMKKIARDGIQPTDLKKYAVRNARPAIAALSGTAARDIAKSIFTK